MLTGELTQRFLDLTRLERAVHLRVERATDPEALARGLATLLPQPVHLFRLASETLSPDEGDELLEPLLRGETVLLLGVGPSSLPARFADEWVEYLEHPAGTTSTIAPNLTLRPDPELTAPGFLALLHVWPEDSRGAAKARAWWLLPEEAAEIEAQGRSLTLPVRLLGLAKDHAQKEALQGGAPGRIPVQPPAPAPAPSRPTEVEHLHIASHALSDLPSEEDLLGFSDYAGALADFIQDKNTRPPITLAIDAAWGMGKTTLMKLIEQQLPRATAKNPSGFPIVWFNAWKYDKEESLWAALVLAILHEVRSRLEHSFWKRQWFWMKLNWKRLDRERLLQRVLKTVAGALAFLVLGLAVFLIGKEWLGLPLKLSLPKYTGILSALSVLAVLYTAGRDTWKRFIQPLDVKLAQYVREPNYRERIGFLAEFEEDFKQVIQTVTRARDGSERWPLVVFIDDLDRCAPPRPVEVMEAINMLLGAEDCIFILGMDVQTVASSIEAKYEALREHFEDPDDPGGLRLGQRFLEKILQFNFRIPAPDSQRMQGFIDTQLHRLRGEKPVPTAPAPESPQQLRAEQLIKAEQRAGTPLEQAVSHVRERGELPDEDVTKARETVLAKSLEESEEARRAIHEAAIYLGYNPRKVIRFINIFRLQALIAQRRGMLDGGGVQLRLLARAVIIAMRWPDFTEAMTLDSEFAPRLREAHAAREKLKCRIKAERNQELEARIAELLTDARMKRLLQAHELLELLAKLSTEELERLPYHLHLAQLTARPRALEAG